VIARLRRALRHYRRPDHIGWGGDPADPFAAVWNPWAGEIR
jgi:hypothetical protein